MIHLVGENHKNLLHQQKIKEYVQKASRKEVVVFLEGLSADPQKAFQYVQKAYQIEDGLVFGYESEIVNAICGLLLHLGYCRDERMKDDAKIGNLQTCYNIFALKKVQDA